ncbi:aminodeoxychorismate/anthranilate synthase component II, partial [candidate division GN15 bacterium]
MLLLIDNYDSFVYNIYHWIDLPEDRIRVARNDTTSAEQLLADHSVKAIILSPGPMGPDKAGISNDLVRLAAERSIPLLGICLGFQCVGQVFGCKIAQHPIPTHGKPSEVELSPNPLFDNLPPRITAGRYHSLEVSRDGFNHDDLGIIARLDDSTIMGVQHRKHPIYGLQFHPESVLTGDNGRTILNNFARLSGLR